MMGLAFSRAAAVAVVALAMAACGSVGATPPAASQNGSAVFVARARQVIAQWDRSSAARTWRTGLVLLDASELTSTPPDVGFSSGQQKDAFGSGHFKLAGTLPTGALHGLVRWANGSTLRVPSLTAAAAFAELATQQPAYRYQSNGAVVVGSWEKSDAGNTPCADVGIPRTARVTLTHPLGTRVILDVASGLPVVTGFQIP